MTAGGVLAHAQTIDRFLRVVTCCHAGSLCCNKSLTLLIQTCIEEVIVQSGTSETGVCDAMVVGRLVRSPGYETLVSQ